MNVIKLSDPKSIEGVSEILSFDATPPNSIRKMIEFNLEFSKVPYDSGISPGVLVKSEGKTIAAIRPEVTTDDSTKIRKVKYHTIAFSIAKEYISESELQIQFYPNTDKLVTYRIGMTAATVITKNGEDYVRVPLVEFLKSDR